MPAPHLPYEEERALKDILHHHGVEPERRLVADLAALIGWVRQAEQSKASFGAIPKPPVLLAFLGTRGIHGKAVLDPPAGDR